MARGLQKVIQKLCGAVSNYGPVMEMINALTEEMQKSIPPNLTLSSFGNPSGQAKGIS